MREWWIIIGALGIVAIAIFVHNKNRSECESKGGVYIRGSYDHVCMRGEVIK